MKLQRLLIALTTLNFLLLAYLLAQGASASSDVASVLRGRALEIIDAQGRVRASISVLPATAASRGDANEMSETAILRLMNTHGRPAVKIATSDEGSGLSLIGGADSHETYLTLSSKGTSSQVKIRNADGKERVLQP